MAPVESNGSTKPDEVTHPTENKEWLLKDQEALAPISERYEGKGKSITYLTSELFKRALSDDKSMETQRLNFMRQKANVLKTVGQLFKDSLVAIAMVISLPPTCSTLRTILMAADDKLTTDAVINQVLIEEKSRKVSSAHSALTAKTAGRSKQKGKGKVNKEEKGKKSCTYCSKSGHTEDECWAKRAAERAKEKDDASKEESDEKELAARVATMGATHLPPLRLFMARHVSAPTQRDANSTASAQTMCHEHKLFDSHPPLLFSRLATPGNGKTVPTQDAGDTPKQAPMPLIAGNRMPREAVPPQLNKLKSVSLDGENQRLAKTSTDGLSHLTVDEINLKATKAEGLACGTGPQRDKIHSNSPGQTRAPTSTMEGPDGLTTHALGLNHKGKAVNGLGSASVPSDRRKSRQQGVSPPKFEFGDERIKTDVRSDEKRTNDKGLTYQRAPSQPLDAPTRNAPPKGKVDGWRGRPSIKTSGGPTIQGTGPKRLEDAENESVNPSDRSDRDGSRHQGDSNLKLEFGGEETKTEVRKDAKRMKGDGHTSQRVPWQPLEPPTRFAPPTGKTDDLQGPTCGQN